MQGLRKFEEVYGRTHRGALSQCEAAEGVSERTFRRYVTATRRKVRRGDRRLGRASTRRAGVDEVARLPELFDTRYRDFNARHFHEKLVAEHGVRRSCNPADLAGPRASARGAATPTGASARAGRSQA